MKIKRHIPNAFTCGNLLCGCVALMMIFEGGHLTVAAFLVGLALLFDFFDGFAARLLKVPSAIGKDLDSLADMVTFGVVPGMVMYKLLSYAIIKPYIDLTPAKEGWTINPAITGELVVKTTHNYLPYLALMIPVFSCIRLAKFNNDTRQAQSFIGLPTPSNAMVICSLPLIAAYQGGGLELLFSPVCLAVLTVVLSLLLVAELPLFALKFKNFGWAENKLRFVFLALSLLLVLLLGFVAIPLVIFFYILASIVNNIFSKNEV